MRLALLLACLPCVAQAACPAPSMQDDLLKDALRFNAYALTAWGLNDRGNMEELWMDEAGGWVVVETTPGHCSTVLSRPSQPMGRLSTPSNDTDTFGAGTMTEGEGL